MAIAFVVLRPSSRTAYNELRFEEAFRMKLHTRALPTVVIAAFLALPARADVGMSDATGKVEDAQGNPIVGAVVTFTNLTNERATYDAKTDKKGRYVLSGLLYNPPGMSWKVSVSAPGYVASKMKVESKTQTAVIAKFETNLKPDAASTEVPIRPFGDARVDIVMVPADEAAQAAAAPAREAAPAAPQAPASDDPLAQATRRISEGDLEGSVEFFEKAIEMHPDDLEARESLAKVLFKLERYGPAEAQALKWCELAAGRPGPNRLLASVHIANGQYEKAKAALDKERQLAPNDLAVLTLAAEVAQELGRKDEAIEVNEAIVRIKPDHAQAWVALGGFYAEQGESEKSEAAFRKVVELDPTNASQTFYNIGVLILNRPNPTPADTRKAIDAFRKAVEINPKYGAAQKQLAFALLNVGDMGEARRALERYLELQPNATDAKELRDLAKTLPPK